MRDKPERISLHELDEHVVLSQSGEKNAKDLTRCSSRASTVSDSESASSSPVPFKSWKSHAEAIMEQPGELRKLWLEPDHKLFKVRGADYLNDHAKVVSDSPLFELVWFDLFEGNHDDMLHMAENPKGFYQRARAKYGDNMPKILIVTWIVPGSPIIGCVHYFALKQRSSFGFGSSSSSTGITRSESVALDLWQRFWNGDDAFRKKRLKFIPNLVDGPWLLRKSVGSKPLIISNALQVNYHKGDHYLEASIDICSDLVARHVTSMCRTNIASLVVDMAFVIEGQEEEELPETLLCCVRYDHLDLKWAYPVKHAKSS